MELCRFNIFGDICFHAVTQKDTSRPLDGSLALHTGDCKETIIENRKKFILNSGANNCNIVLANQTHSSNIAVIENNQTSRGWDSEQDAIEDCDGIITDKRNILIGVLTADCVPILLCDKNKMVVGAVHAGWRGTNGNIVKKAIKLMIDVFGTNPSDVLVGIGPSIGVCCYEVGIEVSNNFKENVKIKKNNGKFMLDLKLENYNQLISMGVKQENIEISNICTSCKSNKFFSYRKEEGCKGRFLSIIGFIVE